MKLVTQDSAASGTGIDNNSVLLFLETKTKKNVVHIKTWKFEKKLGQ